MKGIGSRIRIALAILALAALASGAFGQAAMASPGAKAEEQTVRAAIVALFDRYTKAVNSLDTELWLANWDEEGIKYMANAPAFVGKASITSLVRSKWPQYESRRMSIAIEQTEASGDLAIARGTYTSEDRLKGAGSSTLTKGWFLTVFRRQADGSWRIYRDCVGPTP